MRAVESQWYGRRRLICGSLFLLNLLIALGLTLLFLPFYEHPSASVAWRVFVENFIYSQSVGLLAGFVVPSVALRVWRRPPLARWTLFISCLLAVAVCGTSVAVGCLWLLGLVGTGHVLRTLWAGIEISSTVTLIVGSTIFVFESLRQRAEATTLQLKQQQLESERVQKLAAEARFSSLESRLRPHFLFNTINSVLALIRDDPQAAEQMLERLSRLLRSALDAQQHSVVTLGDELRLVEDYLEIEKMRFGARLNFRFDVQPEALACRLPGYALQTLVENSMKHVVGRRREGGSITLSAARRDDGLEVEVADDGPGFTRADFADGHGLDTLEKRMQALFGDAGALKIESGAGCSVRLTISAGGGRVSLRVYVVDDEVLALRRLERLLRESGRVEIVGSSSDPLQAIKEIEALAPEALFLDIQMPELTGFELLAQLSLEPLVVFATAYDQYALQAFEVNSIDYLLKPVDLPALDRALTKLERMARGQSPRPDVAALIAQLKDSLGGPGRPEVLERIASRMGEHVHFIDLKRVSHFYAEDKLTFAATPEKDWAVDKTIAELEQRLDAHGWVRVHRSTLVNLSYADELYPWFGGRMILRLRDAKKTEITVARDRLKELKERLGL